jgi:phosphoglycerate dehydrogenase-like enzyme
MKLLVHSDEPETLLGVLEKRLPDAAITCCRDYASLPAMLDRERPDVLYTVRFAGTPGFPRQAIAASLSLRWVSVGGSGTDHLAPWDPSRLIVTNAAGVGAETMAQYAVAAMLSFTLGLPALAADQHQGRWAPRRVASVKGRTLAILGLGQTGRATARLANALGMRVTGIRARPLPTAHIDRVVGPECLHEILGEADFVLVCLPLTQMTRGLIDAPALLAMKPGAVLIDVSRGGIVRQAALIDALRAGRLAGAALDVFETEPLPRDNPLWAMDNVIITPHCSSVYDGWERRAVEMFCDNADRWRQGLGLENIVDPQRGY